jgi:hypothetical protein
MPSTKVSSDKSLLTFFISGLGTGFKSMQQSGAITIDQSGPCK